MMGLDIKFQNKAEEGPAFPELIREQCIHLGNESPPIKIVVLDGGMKSGRPSICLRIDLPDGRVVVAETSARLFCTAGLAIAGRYPDLFDG